MAHLEAVTQCCATASVAQLASTGVYRSRTCLTETCTGVSSWRRLSIKLPPPIHARCQHSKKQVFTAALTPRLATPTQNTSNTRDSVKRPHSFTARPGQSERACERDTAVEAIPTAVSAVVVFGVVVTAGIVLSNLPKEKVAETLGADKPRCEACGGSGICPVCQGEGFVNKELSPEEKARAKAKSTMAATRYTAGLAKKWRYCVACNGSRGCTTCQGKGYLDGPVEGNKSKL